MSVAAHPLTIRIGQWIAGQRGPESGDILLDRRRVYILPTTPGLVFGGIVLLLLIGSINYELQLGYGLTFLVASMAIVGMHTTHSNLAQIVLRGVRVESIFAGDVAVFEVTATNPTTLDRFALRFAFIDPAIPQRTFTFRRRYPRPSLTVSTELPARGDRSIGVPIVAPCRGRLPAPRIVIETRYPFGLWRAWAYLTPALTAIVFPAPEVDAPPPPLIGAGGGEGVGLAASGDEFAGVRPYSPGDPQKMIAWRLAARSEELSVKQFEAQGGGDLLLDFDSLPRHLDVEQRLSRLTRWVLDADAAHARYALKLPGTLVFPGSDAQHRERCLTALALHRG